VDQHEREDVRIDDVVMSIIGVAVGHVSGFPCDFLLAKYIRDPAGMTARNQIAPNAVY
jgi:hypothetical protein